MPHVLCSPLGLRCRTPGPSETMNVDKMRESDDFPTSDQATKEGAQPEGSGLGDPPAWKNMGP
jgi:hypothetical protein